MPLPSHEAVSAMRAPVGEKHSREGDVSSPHAAIVEIIHGITQPAAAAHAADRTAAAACVYSVAGLSALLRAPSTRSRAHFLLSQRGAGPPDAGVVRLVARDATLLVFTDAQCAPLSVSAETGRRVCPGDAVLFRRPAAAETDSGAQCADAAVAFVGLAPAALADAADAALAAGANAMACAGFVRRLLACPPGIAQLTCVAQCMHSNDDLWTRALQLPLLLLQTEGLSRGEQTKQGHGAERREVQWIRRIVHSVLRIVVIVLSSAEAIMPMPRVAREAAHAFLASPLFVDGVTVVLPRLVDVVTESTWAAVQQTMHDAVRLALRIVCREDVDTCIVPHSATEAERQAEHGFFTVLHRLTDPKVGSESSLFPVDMGSRGAVPVAGQRAMVQLVGELARTGVLRRVAHWIRSRERTATAANLVDRANCPPNLQDVRELHGLRADSVAEMISAMTQTYSPYLRHEPGRFAEGAVLAAYAELYGPASRAASRFIDRASSSSSSSSASGADAPTRIAAAAAEMRGLRVVDLAQPALRSSLDQYTLREVEMHALFGVPVRLLFGTTEDPARRETFDAQMQELIATTRDSSLFAFVVILLHEKTFLFPVILCDVALTVDQTGAAAAATAFILRDRDMLPSLLAASGASINLSSRNRLRPGHPMHTARDLSSSAWLLYTDVGLTSRAGDLSDPPPRLLPRGTSAVSYALYIQHVCALLARLRLDDQPPLPLPQSSSSSSALRPAKARDEARAAGGPLWWRAMGAGAGAAEHFAPDAALPGEADAAQRALSAVAAAAALSAAQVECLHTLAGAGPGLRALAGAVGSGKTAVACAAGLTRGRALAALRAQHQPQWLAAIRRSAQGLRARLEELAAAEDVAELFGAAGADARETLEDAAGAAEVHAREHALLSERLQHCNAPLLLRPRAHRAAPPPAQALGVLCAELDFSGKRDATGAKTEKEEEKDVETEGDEEKGVNAEDKGRALAAEFQSLDDLLANGHRRALHAPLVAVLRERMTALRRIGEHCDAIRRVAEGAVTGKGEQEEETDESHGERGQLCEELLPWLMARRERCESLAEAARRAKPWAAYIAEDLWDAHSFIAPYLNSDDKSNRENDDTHNNDTRKGNNNNNNNNNDDGRNVSSDTMWMCLKPVEGEFQAVELPSATRGLCVYGRAEALAWRTVFATRQHDFAVHLQHTVIDEAQQIFVLLYDVMCAVAAAPPTARGGATNKVNTPTVISTTGFSLLHALPLLRAYRPRVLIIDDYDQLVDALFLTLAPAAAVVLTQQVEAPLPHERHAAGAVFTALRRTIGASPLMSSASLAESQRLANVSLHTAVQLCRNAHIDTRRAAIRAAAAALVSDSSQNNNNNNNESGNTQTVPKSHLSRHARNQAKNQPKSESEGAVEVKSDSDERTENRLPGFSSPSSVELWTHAVPLHAAIAADACAASFIRRRILAIDEKIKVSVFTPFPADMGAMAADASFSLFTSEYIESDLECDVAVLCVSGIASRVASLPGSSRAAQWAHAAESSFVGCLEWWLWRVIGRARRGAVLIGSCELFDALEPLRRVARFAAHEREAKGYWLPPEAQAAALALCCPDHERSREIAVISMREDNSGGAKPFIQFSGARQCRSLCLKSYDNCGNSSHACLRLCHTLRHGNSYKECEDENDLHRTFPDNETPQRQTDESLADSDSDNAHAHCPFPCGRVPSCGHVCVRRCGDVCDPCEFVGLYELPCGQQVVSGTADAGGAAFSLVRHFQRVRCGAPPQLCDARVTRRCGCCGTRREMRCADADARDDGACDGCDAIVKRVAAEFGAREGKGEAESGEGERGTDGFSEAAREKLQKLRGFAARKAQLMLQTEALEAMQGKPDAECNRLRRAHAEQREQQAEEIQQHKQRVQAAMQEWAKTLREKFEQQMKFNEEMDTEVPLMISQAVAEAERQETFHFA